MTILETAIKKSGLKKIKIAESYNISNKTLYNWTNYYKINNIIKFLDLCLFLNIDLNKLIEEYKNKKK